MDDDEEYAALITDKVIADLAKAWAKTESNRLYGPVMAVESVIDFFTGLGAPDEALLPLVWTEFVLQESYWSRIHKGKPGPKHKTFAQLTALSSAAASVSVLKKRRSCSVDEAVSAVAKATKIPKDDIRKFRDALHRGSVDEVFDERYSRCCKRYDNMADTQIDALLKQIGAIYRMPNL